MYLVSILIKCLLGTVVIETTLGFLLGARKNDLVIILLAQVITNPLLVFLCNFISGKFYTKYGLIVANKSYTLCLIILEILAFIIEGRVYRDNLSYKRINPYILSLILNLSSFFLPQIFNFI